jgi:hypothetical protein
MDKNGKSEVCLDKKSNLKPTSMMASKNIKPLGVICESKSEYLDTSIENNQSEVDLSDSDSDEGRYEIEEEIKEDNSTPSLSRLDTVNFQKYKTRTRSVKKMAFLSGGVPKSLDDIEKLESPLYRVTTKRNISYMVNNRRMTKVELKKAPTMSR